MWIVNFGLWYSISFDPIHKIIYMYFSHCLDDKQKKIKHLWVSLVHGKCRPKTWMLSWKTTSCLLTRYGSLSVFSQTTIMRKYSVSVLRKEKVSKMFRREYKTKPGTGVAQDWLQLSRFLERKLNSEGVRRGGLWGYCSVWRCCNILWGPQVTFLHLVHCHKSCPGRNKKSKWKCFEFTVNQIRKLHVKS